VIEEELQREATWRRGMRPGRKRKRRERVRERRRG